MLKTKRLLSILLTLAMVFAAMPLTANAAAAYTLTAPATATETTLDPTSILGAFDPAGWWADTSGATLTDHNADTKAAWDALKLGMSRLVIDYSATADPTEKPLLAYAVSGPGTSWLLAYDDPGVAPTYVGYVWNVLGNRGFNAANVPNTYAGYWGPLGGRDISSGFGGYANGSDKDYYFFADTAGTYTITVDIIDAAAGTPTPLASQTISITVKPRTTGSMLTVTPASPSVPVTGGTVTLAVTLAASAPTIDNPVYKWYTSESSTTVLHTGPYYTTPTLTSTTTYYVSVFGDNYAEGEASTTGRKAVTVTAATPITSAAVTVTAPVHGANPDFTVTVDPGDVGKYTATIAWWDIAASAYMIPTDTFVTGNTYDADVTFTAADGYSITDEIPVTINGTSAIYYSSPNYYTKSFIATAPPLPPLATTPQKFYSGSFVSDLYAQGIGIKWYLDPTGGSALTPGTALTSRIYYAAQSNADGESPIRTAVNVVIDNTMILDPPPIVSPQDLCGMAKISDIAIPSNINPNNIAWYMTETGGSRLLPTDALVSGGTYYAAAQSGGWAESARTAVQINIMYSTVPGAPSITTPQNFAPGAVVADIAVPNNQISIYATETVLDPLSPDTVLETGTYFAAQRAGDSEITSRSPVIINIDTTSAPTAPSPQSFPDGGTLADLAITGRGVKWYDSNTSTTPLSPDIPLATGNYYAANYGGGPRTKVAVNPTVDSIEVVDGIDGWTPVTVPKVGQVLLANIQTSAGTIGGFPPSTDLTYRWYYQGIGGTIGSTAYYTVTESDIGKTICVEVTGVAPAYSETATWTALVPVPAPVAWNGLTANGASGTTTTTQLTLTFDVDPTALTAADITVTGATKGTLSGTGLTRTLAISNITVANGADVTVAIANPVGFVITPASKTVAAYTAPALSNDASLLFVAGKAITTTGGAGTIADPYTAAITVPNSKSSLVHTDLVPAAAAEDRGIFSDATFMWFASPVLLKVGTNQVYAGVLAEDCISMCFYAITVTRQSSSGSSGDTTQPPATQPPATIPNNAVTNALKTDNPTVTIKAGDSTVLSGDSLKAIKDAGKKITFVLPNGLEITIDPATIDDHFKNIDLNIKVEILGKATAVDGVKLPANSIVITPSAKGAFGFEISVKITAKQLADAGLNGNNVKLYYVDDNGKVTDMGKAKLNADGSVTFTISHASFYVLSETTPGEEETVAWQNPFTDVKKGDWFYGDVEYAVTNGLMVGTSAELFSPNNSLTRAMLVTILYRLEGEPNVNDRSLPFSDVAPGQWYTNAVIWAEGNGIVSGYGDGNFGPNNNITREQLAVILMRYMNYKEIVIPVTQQWIIFADEADISDYAMDAIQTFNKLGIINGSGKNENGQVIVNPKGNATRAEAAAMLHRFLELIK